MMQRIKNKLKDNNSLYILIVNIVDFFKFLPCKLLLLFFRIFPINRRRIFICSFYDRGYGDSPKYICDEIKRQNKNYEIIWACNPKYFYSLPNFIKPVKTKSIMYYYYLVTSKVWIDNCRKEYYVKKRKNQVYIQLWHGGIGMKKVEQLAGESLGYRYIKSAINDSKMMDYAISNSLYRTKIYKESFWYSGKVLELGCPRNDLFFKESEKKQIIKKVYDKFQLEKKDNIVLYVPTFRSSYNFDYKSFDFKKLINKLEEKNGEKYKLIIKLHSNVKEKIDSSFDNVIDASSYQDVDELLLCAKIVISDYSSVIFDSLYTDSQKYLYAPDIELYNKDRGLNVDYKSLPFSISYNSDELISSIVNNKSYDYEEKTKKFMSDMRIVDDGKSSERVVNLIEKCIGGDK